jgi:hypothetical protein
MTPERKCYTAAKTGASERLGTRRPASCGPPTCREQATCVPDPGHCEPPDGKRSNSTVPGCGVRSRGVRDNPADRTRERKKNFCCVTTRRRNLWMFNSLGRSLGPLTALALGLGMPGFGLGSLAVFGLPPRRLPLADLAETFRLLAVALVPAPRLVLAATPFAHAVPWARSAPSGRAMKLSLNVEGAHGRLDLPREKLGENVSAFSSGDFKTRTRRLPARLAPSGRTRQRRKRI